MEATRRPSVRSGGEVMGSARIRRATAGVGSKKETPVNYGATSSDNASLNNTSGGNVTGGKGKAERNTEVVINFNGGRGGYRGGSPPLDYCCPICYGSFNVPCKANCGHWFCGNCILEYWGHSSGFKPCKCPFCSSGITKLTPLSSLNGLQEREVTKVLESVQRYNRIFVGGAFGLLQRMKMELKLRSSQMHESPFTGSIIRERIKSLYIFAAWIIGVKSLEVGYIAPLRGESSSFHCFDGPMLVWSLPQAPAHPEGRELGCSPSF